MAKHFIYIIAPEHGLGHVKIGYTNNVQRRLTELQTGHPERLKVFYTKEVSGKKKASLLEERAHKRLVGKRMVGEWFDVTPAFAETVLTTIEMNLGLNPEAAAAKLAELESRFDYLRDEDTRLTDCLVQAKRYLDGVQKQWARNLTELQRTREQLDFYKLEDA